MAVLAAAVAAFMALPLTAGADFRLGVSLNNGGLNGFYFAVGEYNRVQPRQVVVIKQRGIPDEELAVVFFIASRARVSPDEVIALRLKNRWSWVKIVRNYRISPEVFYVPVDGDIRGGPYGRAYGYYKKHPRDKWSRVKLTDKDIINLVNLRFVSEYHKYKPAEVIKMRESGRSFVVIHEEIRKTAPPNRAPKKPPVAHKGKK